MAGRIAGITIEIGGDTTKLTKALSGTDSSIKKTQDALKDVNKLLKLDPGNTELLKQKYRDLGSAIDDTKSRLQQLKEAEKQVSQNKGNYSAWKNAYEPIQKEIDKTSDKTKKLKEQLKKLEEGGKVDTDEYRKLQAELANTEEKAKQLRKEAKAVSDQFGNPISPEQFDALQREIIETEQKLKGLNGEMREFGSVGAQKIAVAGEKFEKFGGKISALGGKMSAVGTKLLPVTGAIVGAGTAAVKSWQEVDSANDTIIKKTGATGDALADMQQRAANLAHSIPTDFGTAGEAIGEVNTRFELTGDALEELSGKFVKFAALNDTDVTTSVDTVQKAMAAWGVETKDAGAYLDTLNAASQQTGVAALNIAASAATNAAALKEMGYSASDSAVFLANLEKNGIDTSAAMTGLKKAYTESLKEGTSLSGTLGDLESRLKNQSTASDAAAEAIELFGSRAGGALVEAVRTGRLSFGELGTVMEDFAGNVENTFEATLDPLDELKTQMNELKSAGADLVDAAAPLIRDVLGKSRSLIKKVTDALGKLTDKQKQTAIKTAGIVAAVGPALMIGGKVVSAVGSVVQGVGKAMQLVPKIVGGIKTVGTAILGLNPAVLATVGAVAAVTAGVVALHAAQKKRAEELYGLTDAQKQENAALAENAQAVRDAAAARQETMNGISEEYGYYQSLADELRNITDANGKVKAGYEDRAAVITGLLSEALGIEISVTDGVIGKYDELMGKIDQVIEKKQAEAMIMADQEAYTNAIKTVGDAETDYLQKVNEQAEAYANLQKAEQEYADFKARYSGMDMTNPFDALESADLKANVDATKTAYEEASQAVKNTADTYVNAVTTIQNHEALLEASISGEGLQQAITNLQNGFMTAVNATKEQLAEQLSAAEEHYNTLKEAMSNGATLVSDQALQDAAAFVEQCKAEYEKGGGETGESYDKGVAQGIADKKDSVKTEAEGMKDITDVDLNDEGVTTGESYGKGVVQGIRNYRDVVAAEAAALAGLIPKNTNSTLEVRSPSRVAKRIGGYWDQGLINGMKEKMPEVAAMSRTVSGAMIADAAPMMRYQDPRTAAAKQAAEVVSRTVTVSGGTDNAALQDMIGLLQKIEANKRKPLYAPGGELLGWIEEGLYHDFSLAARGY